MPIAIDSGCCTIEYDMDMMERYKKLHRMDRNREIKRVIQEVALRLLEHSGVTHKELAQVFESIVAKLESPCFSREWLQDLDNSYRATKKVYSPQDTILSQRPAQQL